MTKPFVLVGRIEKGDWPKQTATISFRRTFMNVEAFSYLVRPYEDYHQNLEDDDIERANAFEYRDADIIVTDLASYEELRRKADIVDRVRSAGKELSLEELLKAKQESFVAGFICGGGSVEDAEAQAPQYISCITCITYAENKMTKREKWEEAQKEAQYCLEQWQVWNQKKTVAEEKVQYWQDHLKAIRLVCDRLDREAGEVNE